MTIKEKIGAIEAEQAAVDAEIVRLTAKRDEQDSQLDALLTDYEPLEGAPASRTRR